MSADPVAIRCVSFRDAPENTPIQLGAILKRGERVIHVETIAQGEGFGYYEKTRIWIGRFDDA